MTPREAQHLRRILYAAAFLRALAIGLMAVLIHYVVVGEVVFALAIQTGVPFTDPKLGTFEAITSAVQRRRLAQGASMYPRSAPR